MEIRPATEDDQPAIRAVHDAAFEARALGLECKWDLDEPWMALRLPRYDPGLRGLVRYPPAFG